MATMKGSVWLYAVHGSCKSGVVLQNSEEDGLAREERDREGECGDSKHQHLVTQSTQAWILYGLFFC